MRIEQLYSCLGALFLLIEDLLKVGEELWPLEGVLVVVGRLFFFEAAIGTLASLQVSACLPGEFLGLNHLGLVSLNLLGLLAVDISEPPRNLPDSLLVLSVDALADGIKRIVFDSPKLSPIIPFEYIQISHLLALFKHSCNPALSLT